jgi:hypothetical protein
MMLDQANIHMQKNTHTHTHTHTHINLEANLYPSQKLTQNRYGPKCKMQNCETPTRWQNPWQSQWSWVWWWFFGYNITGVIHEESTDKLDFIKIKHCCSVKDTVKRIKRQAMDWEKISAKRRLWWETSTQAGTLPLESHLQSILLWCFGDVVSWTICLGWPGTTILSSQPPKYVGSQAWATDTQLQKLLKVNNLI